MASDRLNLIHVFLLNWGRFQLKSDENEETDLSLCDPVPRKLDNGKVASAYRALNLVETNPVRIVIIT